MDNEQLQALRKSVRKAKRIAAEHAGALHDLVEERLPQDYQAIPEMAQSCYDACQHWAELNRQLQELEQTAV